MNLAGIVKAVTLVWALSEVALIVATRQKRRGSLRRDRGSSLIFWGVIGAGLALAALAQTVAAARIRIPASWLSGVSLLLLVGGLVIRWAAILTLGRFFTTSVAVQPDHRLVRTGLYRRVRHPSYSGLLLVFVGLGFSHGNWLSLAAVVIPFLAALLYRIHVEEAALTATLGPEYVAYSRLTKRLVPGLF